MEILRCNNISKDFNGIYALSKVNFSVNKGEIMALCGENGAGKTTLIKIIGGVFRPTTGDILWKNKKVNILEPVDAQRLGIGIVHQDFPLAPHLSVKENVEMGRMPLKKFGFVDWTKLSEKVSNLCDEYDIELDYNSKVGDLPIAKRQMASIIRALAVEPDLFILDEPTSSLSIKEIKKLFNLINILKAKGTSIIYISHYLNEVMQIADRCMVLRDGEVICTVNMKEITKDDIVKAMVGRYISLKDKEYNRRDISDVEVLRVENLTCGNTLKNVSFSLKKGEILGIGGSEGSGRSEILHSLWGNLKHEGNIYVGGKKVNIRSVTDAKKYGFGLVPEDREIQALFHGLSIRQNITVSSFPQFTKYGIVNKNLENTKCSEYVNLLKIKIENNEQEVRFLSGGNQQKSVFARWAMNNPQILLLDEPTYGVDVGAKEEIYKIIHKMVDQGISVIMVSSDLPELLRISDRILIISKGEIVDEASHDEASEDWFMRKVANI